MIGISNSDFTILSKFFTIPFQKVLHFLHTLYHKPHNLIFLVLYNESIICKLPPWQSFNWEFDPETGNSTSHHDVR